jgi:hypothetical protein
MIIELLLYLRIFGSISNTNQSNQPVDGHFAEICHCDDVAKQLVS